MPVYCFRKPNGEVVEEFIHGCHPPKFITIDGVKATRDFRAEWCGRSAIGDPWVFHKSMAMMVNPLVADKYRKEMVDIGVNGKIDEHGFISLDSKKDFDKYKKYNGWTDYGAYD